MLGAVLDGSRGVPEFVTPASDYDVYIVLREASDRYPFTYGARIEMIARTLNEFRMEGMPGSGSEWNRPTFQHVRVEIDKLDGEIQRLVDEKARLGAEEARTLAADALDDYINTLYRSLRNGEAGRALAARLDGVETIRPLLVLLFAIDGRVRPFNKWLEYEVQQQPLSFPDVLDRVAALAADPSAEAQRRVFGEVERLARERGMADLVDLWEPHVEWLRTGAAAEAQRGPVKR